MAVLILFISIGIFIYFENFELKNNDIKISNNYKYTIEIPGKKLSKFSYSSDNLNVCEVDKNDNITSLNNGKAYLLTGYHKFNTKDSITNKSYNSVLRIFNVDSSVNLSYAGYKGIVTAGSSVNLQNIEVEGLDIIDNKLLVYTSDSTDTKNQKRGVIHVFPI